MRLSGRSALLIRKCGAVWLVTAPILWVMAAMGSVTTEIAGIVQLVAFSTVAIVGFVCGVGALFQQSWAAVGLLAVSWVAVAYFFGIAAYILVFPFVPWSTLKAPGVAALPMALGLAAMIAPFGIPFLVMALAVKRTLRDSPGRARARAAGERQTLG
jgi:hypothetical protein